MICVILGELLQFVCFEDVVYFILIVKFMHVVLFVSFLQYPFDVSESVVISPVSSLTLLIYVSLIFRPLSHCVLVCLL